MIPIVLASASPRRRALLETAGVSVSVQASDADEISDGTPEHVVLTNARAKCETVATQKTDPAIIIAADTIVVLDENILGKPSDLHEARTMLRSLSGHTHSVFTGVAVKHLGTGTHAEAVEETRVTFRNLSDADIDVFVETVKPLDRAGAYTVDGPGALLVERYEGCFTNVLGLPMIGLDRLLRELGDGLFPRVSPDTARFW